MYHKLKSELPASEKCKDLTNYFSRIGTPFPAQLTKAMSELPFLFQFLLKFSTFLSSRVHLKKLLEKDLTSEL